MTSAPGDGPDKDQSMDDILASIRRIMLDEQARLQDGPASGPRAEPEVSFHPFGPDSPAGGAKDVVILDDSMVIGEMPSHLEFNQPLASEVEVMPMDDAAIDVALPVAHHAPAEMEMTVSATTASPAVVDTITPQSIEALLAPAAAAAAAASVDALLRQLNDEHLALLKPASSSPSIEEVVRSELRPMLKSWLDENLPSLVERLVRVELARLTGRPGI